MNIASLKLFCDLVETESFTRSAERNHLSQSAVSQRISALERHLNQTLLDRGRGRGAVYITLAGRTLYDGARSLVNDCQDLEARVRCLGDEISGEVRVATVYSVGLHSLSGCLKPFLRAYPQVKVHLEYSRTDKIYDDVSGGVVDIGIVACPTSRTGLEIIAFSEDPMVVVCAPDSKLAKLSVISLEKLNDVQFVAFAQDVPTRDLVDSHLLAAGAQVKVVAAYDNIETIKNLTEIGLGIAILPADTVKQEVRDGRLVSIPIQKEHAFKRPTGIIIRRNRAVRGVLRAFVDAMVMGKAKEATD